MGVIVALAIYVSFGRFLMSNVGSYGDVILAELNNRSPFLIEAENVTGEWHSFTPEIVLTGLRLTVPGSDEPPLELAEGRVAGDVWKSLTSRSLQTFRLGLEQLLLRGQLTSEGKLLIAGIGSGGGRFSELLEEFLLNTEQINLNNNQFILELPDESVRLFDLDVVLRREGSFRQLEAELVSTATGTEILIVAKGIGNPMDTETFSGDLFVDVVDSDLRALQQILPLNLDVQLTGKVALQAWLTSDRGDTAIEATIAARNIVIDPVDGDWVLPVDYLSLKARLKQRSDRWTLFASDIELDKGDTQLRLPRMQVDVWSDTVRVRGADVPLAPLNSLFLGLDTTSETMVEVFETLDMRGEFSSLELTVADFHDASSDWEVEGNFRQLQVGSWHGAPGVEAEAGFLQLGPNGGYVVLDSHQFSMDFPTVYSEPLRFDDFYGTVFIDWDSTDVTLSSSLVLAQGPEGRATALFGLNIPLERNSVGLEMDLMVGLKDTHPIHRSKYLPYTLNEGLLNWLKGSIGEGRIQEGAFLWRGSLRKEAPEMRTVQLFFNVADTTLEYHPEWPALSGFEGTVLINDAEVSIWSEKARMYDSRVDFLSAEAWMSDGEEMKLAVNSKMRGDASDGIRVVNESPLSGLVGDVFANWSLSGGLDTSLELELSLTNSNKPPRVKVDIGLDEAELLISPGDLQVDDVSGQLAYSSERGFSSNDLTASLWGEALQLEVAQKHTDEDVGGISETSFYDPAKSTTEITFATPIDMGDIRDWLNLDLLSLAEGKATADMLLRIPPGLAPELTIKTDLSGVSLDLPEPWRKPAAELRQLDISVPLSGDSRVINLAMEKQLFLQVLLEDRNYAGLALGFGQQPERLDIDVISVSGHVPLVDETQWQDFLDRYVYADFSAEPEFVVAEGDVDPLPDEVVAERELDVQIDKLRADTLRVLGQEFSDVLFSLDINGDRTLFAAETDWLRGEMLITEDSEPSRLTIDYINLARLSQLDFTSGEREPLKIPDMDVVLSELGYDQQTLGSVDFIIRADDDLLRFSNIVGSVAGLSLVAQSPGQLLWNRDVDAGETSLEAKLQFEDLGGTMEQLGYQKILETSGGEFDLALKWPGGPQEFSLESLAGSLALDVLDGRYLDTPSGASGTLRVVGILNLADIVERLSLDLSNMFESGIPFHGIEGEVFFHGGSIEVAKMDVTGRSSSFQFTGVSDVASESLDGDLIATLPVANNLPWVAALAMGLPVAAGVFVVSKVFEKQVNRFSSAIYKISGSWEDPEVNFERIFDTSSERKLIIPLGEEDPNTPVPNTIDPNTADPNQATQH